MARNYSRNMSLKETVQEYTVIKLLTELCLTVFDLHFLILYNTTGMSDQKILTQFQLSYYYWYLFCFYCPHKLYFYCAVWLLF